jgi:capsid assembly protease
MISYPHIAQRLFNTPLGITAKKAEVIIAALRERFNVANIIIAEEPASASVSAPASNVDQPFDIVEGIAIIPICGTLVHKLGSLRPWSGMTGYDGIRANLSLALADESVKAIVFDIDSPGGEVSGCFDLVDAIYEARGQKPIWAILSEHAYSAAYAIASATDHIAVPRTGGTGSVGVICLHTDYSKFLDKVGIEVTLIQYGARKAEANEYSPLTDAALANLQADIDTMGELFVSTVARNRKLSPAKVRATEAATFLGAEGVRVGFADAVMAPDEAFAALYQTIN